MANKNELTQLDRIERNSLLASKSVLTFEDVVLLTGFSGSHVYKLTCSRQIPHFKPHGKHIFFDKAEVEDWLKQNRVMTTDEINKEATNYIVTGKMKGGKTA